MNADEVYFACKKAYQELSGTDLTAKLKEIFTPEIQAEMEKKNMEYKEETFQKLNNERMKKYRDQTRKNKFVPRKKTP